jgi:hypothetical protein
MPAAVQPLATLTLVFDDRRAGAGGRKSPHQGLSAVLQAGDALWVADDESAALERLTLEGPGRAASHARFPLTDYLDLPCGPEGDPPEVPEVDIEGLDADGGYLWVVGSHSVKRRKPGRDDQAREAHKALRQLSIDDNRYLLARIPLSPDGRQLQRQLATGAGTLRAARLPGSGNGRKRGTELARLLRQDRHLAPCLDIPGKENGLDIEGLAAAGERVFLGLRGPVLRGWAAILELRVQDDGQGGLQLAPLPGKKRMRLRKHFLDLDGRGLRDLHRDGDDLLLLAGPTMDLDGAETVFRWRDALKVRDASLVRRDQLEELIRLPASVGCNRAEGITVFTPPGAPAGGGRRLLVVHDAAGPDRSPPGASQLVADVYALPPRLA